MLEIKNLHVSVGDKRSSDQPAGTVAATSPDSSGRASRGTTVFVYPSTGP